MQGSMTPARMHGRQELSMSASRPVLELQDAASPGSRKLGREKLLLVDKCSGGAGRVVRALF